MAITLTIDAPDVVLDEQGFALVHAARDEWDSLKKSNVAYEPVSETILLYPTIDPEDTTEENWNLSGATFLRATSPDTEKWGLFQSAAQANVQTWAESKFAVERNGSFSIYLYLFHPPSGQSQAHRMEIFFGGRYRLTLAPGEEAVLSRAGERTWEQGGETGYDYATDAYTEVLRGPLLPDHTDLYDRWHRLWFAPLKRDRVVIKSDVETGLVWKEPDLLEEEGEGVTYHTSTFAARVRVAVSGGAWAFGFGRTKFATAGTLESPTIELGYITTFDPTTRLRYQARPGASASLDVLSRADGDAFSPPANRFAYRISLAGPGTATPSVYRTEVRFPPTQRDRAASFINASSDVLALREGLSLDADGAQLSFDLDNSSGLFDTKRGRSNLRVEFSYGGLPRFRGFSVRSEYRDGPGPRLSFVCSDGWKRLEHARLNHSRIFDGELHTDAVREICLLAGLKPEELNIAEDTYSLPEADDDHWPLFQPRDGESAAAFLRYLRDSFSGWRMGFDPQGRFSYQPPEVGAFKRAFSHGRPLAPGELPIYELEEEVDETGYANEIWVLGMADSGEVLAAYYVDFSSMLDPDYLFYVGERRLLVHVDAALNTQEAVNWVCRTIAENTTRFRKYVALVSEFDSTLIPGDAVTVSGEPYIVRSMTTTLLPRKSRTHYRCERA